MTIQVTRLTTEK